MEDQRPTAGDLTDEPGAGTDAAAEEAVDETVTSSEATVKLAPTGKPKRSHRMPAAKFRPAAPVVEPEEPASQEEAEPPTDESEGADNPTAETVEGASGAEAPRVLREHQPAGKRIKLVAALAAALFIGAGAFAGAAVQPVLADRAVVDTKLDIARTAVNAITTLWTYTPDNMAALPERSAQYLGGDFEAQYRKYVDAVAPTNKQVQITNTTEVVGAAVESLDGDNAEAIVYTNTTSTSPMTKNIPSLRYLSYRLAMERHDSRWLVTRMITVTSLDLTPQV